VEGVWGELLPPQQQIPKSNGTDCGAVTTGPVTVPVLLSLGVGVMRARKQRELARAALEEAALKRSEGAAPRGGGGMALRGFGERGGSLRGCWESAGSLGVCGVVGGRGVRGCS
jgi:hypothetical protein